LVETTGRLLVRIFVNEWSLGCAFLSLFRPLFLSLLSVLVNDFNRRNCPMSGPEGAANGQLSWEPCMQRLSFLAALPPLLPLLSLFLRSLSQLSSFLLFSSFVETNGRLTASRWAAYSPVSIPFLFLCCLLWQWS
jgi:hypothetical protein